jgi:uncharacterized protein
MANPLLDDVLPAELAERSQVFEVEGKVGEFARLVEIVEKDLATIARSDRPREWRQSQVASTLEFGWADIDQALPKVTGHVSARLTTVCQRCLEAFELPMATDICLVLKQDGTESADTGNADTWEMEREKLRLADLIEESLIMAMPLAPMHEAPDECGPLVRDIGKTDGNEETTSRPFADLRSQMEKAGD